LKKINTHTQKTAKAVTMIKTRHFYRLVTMVTTLKNTFVTVVTFVTILITVTLVTTVTTTKKKLVTNVTSQ